MGVVAVSSLKQLSEINCQVVRLSEDIWLTKNGNFVSYVDLLIHVGNDSQENLSSLLIVMDSKIEKASDVSSLWYEEPEKFFEGVGRYMYSRGLKKIHEDEKKMTMSIDGIDCIVPKHSSINILKKLSRNIVKIDFPESVRQNETIGIKIELVQSGVYTKSHVYPKENNRLFKIFPYSHWALGANKLNELGFNHNNLIPVNEYNLYLFLPPNFITDRMHTTKSMTIDLSDCESCELFCPFLARLSLSLGEPVDKIKKDREGIRWKMRNLTKWQGRSIQVLFSPSKPVIKTVSPHSSIIKPVPSSTPLVKPFKIKLVENLLSLLVVSFLVNVIAGLVFTYDTLKLVLSISLLLVAFLPIIYIMKKYSS